MKCEILAPVGNEEMLEAAICAGCDAIYFALPSFGARAFAKNFTLERTKEIIDQCHLLNIKVYITMNTLMHEDEIEEAYTMAKALHEMNVDALIIQDLGFIHLLHHRLPNLTLHASTQLSVSKPEMIENLKKMGVKRVVLARECTIDEIKACQKTGMEIEVFVHGAICICYSGQCYFSSIRYDRSGNRGLCAQPCRMTYSLEKNGEVLSKDKYLLSPKDLSLIDKVKELEEIGVCSLKIEGRMKSKEYVYTSVSQIKKALHNETSTKEDMEKLMVSFNRGYTYGHTYRKRDYDLMNIQSGNHQGIEIGKVIGYEKNRMKIKVEKDLCQNDGIRFVFKGNSEGCRVNFLYDKNGKLTNKLEAHSIGYLDKIAGVRVNSIIRKTVDSQLEKEVESTLKMTNRQIGVQGFVSCKGVGSPLTLTIQEKNLSVTVQSTSLAQEAKNRPTDESILSKQLNKTKDSFIYFEDIQYDLHGNIFFIMSDMNQLRKDGIEAFKAKKLEKEEIVELPYTYTCKEVERYVDVLEIQSKDQMVEFNGNIISELEEETFHKGNVTQVHGDVLGHLGNGNHLDIQMNITNSYAIACLLEMGYTSMVISDELSLEKVILVLDGFKKRYGFDAPISRVIYQKRRLMTMNYCPVHLITNQKNCRECHENYYELVSKDKTRAYCLGDKQCHMRLFDTKPENRMDEIEQLSKHGMHTFKLIMVDENHFEVKQIVDQYVRIRNMVK